MVSLLASSSLPVLVNPELSNINFIAACSAQSHRFMDSELYQRVEHGRGRALSCSSFFVCFVSTRYKIEVIVEYVTSN